MKFLVSEKLSPHKYKTAEGYLVCVDAVLARTGKQSYMRDEIFGDGDETIVEVDRTPEEVFSEATLASFENKPITVEHPSEDVNSENFKEYSVGFVRDVHRGVVDGQDVILGTLVIQDAQTIEEIENGEHTDLSCGYDCDIQDEDNLQQRNIRGNHVALCAEGRAGNAKIMDSRKGLLDTTQKCVICGETFDGYGNNAEPVKKGICCDVCNVKYVIPARINKMHDYVKDSKEELRRTTGNLIREEVNATEDYDNALMEKDLTPRQRKTFEEIRNDEIDHEEKLTNIYKDLKEGSVEEDIEDSTAIVSKWTRNNADAAILKTDNGYTFMSAFVREDRDFDALDEAEYYAKQLGYVKKSTNDSDTMAEVTENLEKNFEKFKEDKMEDSNCKDANIYHADLRRFCIKHDYYTHGSIADYNNLFANLDKWSLEKIAEDIAAHSGPNIWTKEVYQELKKEFSYAANDSKTKDSKLYSITWKNGNKVMKSTLVSDSMTSAIAKFQKYIQVRGIKDAMVDIEGIKKSVNQARKVKKLKGDK